jgi:hypothetical protein
MEGSINSSSSNRGLRSAESNRFSTCSFADEISKIAIEHYKKRCHYDLNFKQTVLAAIILQVPTLDGFTLKVLSFGVGTKIIPIHLSSSKHRVRDCHAEVLARRGFLKYLHIEAFKLLKQRNRTENLSITPVDHLNSVFEIDQISGLFKLRSHYSLHLYTSSAPCGNASIKKWGKSRKPKFYDIPVHSYPSELRKHTRFYPTGCLHLFTIYLYE